MTTFATPPIGDIGPGKSTDKGLVLWSGTTGNSLRGCTVVLTDAGAMSGLAGIETSDASVMAGVLTVGAADNTSVHNLRSPSQTTVGAAGAATALPATPTGYLEIKIQGTAYVIPFYAKA